MRTRGVTFRLFGGGAIGLGRCFRPYVGLCDGPSPVSHPFGGVSLGFTWGGR